MKTIPYNRQWINESDIKEVVKVLKSDWITQGTKIKEFEGALCKYTGAKYAVAVSSGTAALHIAALAAGLKPGDEVITTPTSFVASANCVLYCGANVVFADIQKDTANIDPNAIEKKIANKTRAIISVHFAGQPCDMEKIQQIAKKHNLLIIEDASHALGARYKVKNKWIKVGSCSHSQMTVFSFHAIKSITTGEGGAVLTNDKKLYEKLKMLKSHGITKDRAKLKKFEGPWYYEMQCLGYNYRITDFQCALGISQLKRIEKFIEKRREIVQRYNQAFKDVKEIITPCEKKDIKSAWHLYFVQLKGELKSKRKKIFESLVRKGVGVQVHYFPIYLQPFYRGVGYKKGICPVAEDFYEKVISLPLYPGIKSSEVKYVINAVKKVIGFYKK